MNKIKDLSLIDGVFYIEDSNIIDVFKLNPKVNRTINRLINKMLLSETERLNMTNIPFIIILNGVITDRRGLLSVRKGDRSIECWGWGNRTYDNL